MPAFIPGLELCGLFYDEIVAPILVEDFPDLVYDAGLFGPGSEVQGFDTAQSTDHGWSPRVTLILRDEDHASYADAIKERLRHRLPYQFRGYSTNVEQVPNEPSIWMKPIDSGPVNHAIAVMTVRDIARNYLGVDFDAPLTVVDWLTLPEQRLREVTGGRIYHSGLGDLDAMRRKFTYYPHEVWLYLLACQWMRINQEEPFVGRTGDVGDELGSQVLAGRLVHDVMKLCFLIEKQYAPYPKWFGTGFSRLQCAAQIGPLVQQALLAATWREREKYLSAVYEHIAAMHNALGITEPLPTTVTKFYERPYLVIHANRFYEAIYAVITDEDVIRLPKTIGGIDQYVNSTDIRSNSAIYRKFRVLYED